MYLDFKNNVPFRLQLLKKLLYQIHEHETLLIQALADDFGKPEFEAVITETHFVISDLNSAINNIEQWTKPKRVFPSLLNFPSSDYIYSEPFGKVLIISPWNYPFQLAMCPLIAAITAGNRVTLKPSELTPRTSAVMRRIISQTFDINIVRMVEGGPEVSTELLKQKWDYIFFTGSVAVGKIVAKAAAENLTPVTLELGGKNPCIIHKTANIELAAKRIVWGKFINAGQTCIAPDYLLVHNQDKQRLIAALKLEIVQAYGTNPQESPDFARIINKKNWDRLNEMIDREDILHGGDTDADSLYIGPTLIDQNELESKIMQGEIFGPLLPIIEYDDEDDIDHILNKYPKPLALYIFTSDHYFSEKIIQKFSFGGGCINDTLIHFSNSRLPFGGVGDSGIGAYHGKRSFDLFSHKKSIVKKATWLDIPFRYAPYGNKIHKIKKWLKWF